jgi:uncharacterized membrane protein
MKLLNDLTAYIFTSTSESLSRLLYVWIKLMSVTSFPKLAAIYVKFLERQRRTLQDLSSAAWMIRGMMKVLFSSLVSILAIYLKLSVANTRIWSCSSVDRCFRMPMRSLKTYSFSYTLHMCEILVAVTRCNRSISSFEISENLLNLKFHTVLFFLCWGRLADKRCT